jgi:hypothetical protein
LFTSLSPPPPPVSRSDTPILPQRDYAEVVQNGGNEDHADTDQPPPPQLIISKLSFALNPSAPEFKANIRSEFPSLGGGTQQPGPSAGTWGMRQRSPERRPYGRGMVRVAASGIITYDILTSPYRGEHKTRRHETMLYHLEQKATGSAVDRPMYVYALPST